MYGFYFKKCKKNQKNNSLFCELLKEKYYLCGVKQYNMIVTFEEKYLQELYEDGKTSGKKHRFQPEIVRKYKDCINLMRRVPDTNALKKYNGLNFENLKGDKAGTSSSRVNNKYRIEFTVAEAETEPIVTVCNILELSNHYK
jgi:proteic killer suppression protein